MTETTEPITCAVEMPDAVYGSVYARRCNKPGIQLCEKHLDEERHKAQRGYDEVLKAYDQLRMVLRELVLRVETEATAKVRMCAAVDAAKTVLR